MKVEVRYVGEYRRLTGAPKETIEVTNDAVLGDVLDALVTKYGQEFAHRIYSPEGELSSNCLVFIGETPAQVCGGMEAPLAGEFVQLMLLGSMEGGDGGSDT